jgi:hypothetical protein
MSKNIVLNIIMGAFFIIVIGLVYLNFFVEVDSSDIVYKQYCDDLIDINDNVMFETEANFIDKDTLAVLVHSQEDFALSLYINAIFYDQNGKVVSTETSTLTTFPNNYGVTSISVPDLEENQNPGKIEIQLAGQKIDDMSNPPDISYEANDSYPLTITITNNSASDVSQLVVQAVGLRKGRIVGMDVFYQENLASGASVSEESYAFGTSDDDPLPYDDLLIFTSSANIG